MLLLGNVAAKVPGSIEKNIALLAGWIVSNKFNAFRGHSVQFCERAYLDDANGQMNMGTAIANELNRLLLLSNGIAFSVFLQIV